MAARVAPQAAPGEAEPPGRAEPGSALRSPAASPSRPPRRARSVGALLALYLLLGWLRAGPAGAQQPAEYHGWVGPCGATTTRVPVPGDFDTLDATISAAAPARCATAARRPTPGWSRAAAPATAASWSTRASRRVSTGPRWGRPCPAARPGCRVSPAGVRAKRRARPSPGLRIKGTLESVGGSREKWVVAFQVGGAVPLQSRFPPRGLRRSAQELVRNGPRGPRGLHPVTQGEKRALGARHFKKGCGGRARLDLSFRVGKGAYSAPGTSTGTLRALMAQGTQLLGCVYL